MDDLAEFFEWACEMCCGNFHPDLREATSIYPLFSVLPLPLQVAHARVVTSNLLKLFSGERHDLYFTGQQINLPSSPERNTISVLQSFAL